MHTHYFVLIVLQKPKKGFILIEDHVEMDDSYVAREGTPHARYILISLERSSTL